MKSTGDLLLINPSELKFSHELGKQSSCSMQLGNKTDYYIVFKIKTTDPKKYIVRPNVGIVMPGSTCEVTITKKAPGETSFDYNCKDKFLLLCAVSEHGILIMMDDDVTSDMFTKKPGRVVEEMKFKVVYVSPSPSSSTADSWLSSSKDSLTEPNCNSMREIKDAIKENKQMLAKLMVNMELMLSKLDSLSTSRIESVVMDKKEWW
ncbi:Vesicle-associated protein 1-2 [Zostera marina]|uniref:Vesicle-associated protein 1-2 n=1 Tax=Zostera marina TaxID=29655 RepID=A0A0K9NTU2_ZOSMR|nr:Vesicle-associated protein 1-2 [Zostera marina]